MKVILISKFNNLGSEGDIVDVKPGYVRNFLLPNEKVILATKQNILVIKEKKRILFLKKEKELLQAKSRIEKLNSLGTIKVFLKLGAKEKLFGSINRKDIVKTVVQMGFLVYKHEIKLLSGPLRTLGKHKVIFQPISNKSTTFIIEILPLQNV